ncbi:MAG: peptidoglycan-associated lipoprotein Pal [Rubrivivax sp.]|nr:peptidoglycan-associated lipoprotein Pal [Rubrivivax sp.]
MSTPLHNRSRRSAASLALAAAGLLALAACSSPPQETPVAAAQPVAATPPPPVAAPPAAPTANPGAVAGDGGNRSGTLAVRPSGPAAPGEANVFFAFDEFAIGSEYFPAIERIGRYLAGTPSATVRIEGHADERGSHEYNLALGQKRAEAVRRALRAFGVRDSQVETVSFGEERPRAPGHDEAAWAQNRRADMRPNVQP